MEHGCVEVRPSVAVCDGEKGRGGAPASTR